MKLIACLVAFSCVLRRDKLDGSGHRDLGFVGDLGPGVFQRYDAIEDRSAGLRVLHVDAEIPVAFELNSSSRFLFRELVLYHGCHRSNAVGIDVVQEGFSFRCVLRSFA